MVAAGDCTDEASASNIALRMNAGYCNVWHQSSITVIAHFHMCCAMVRIRLVVRCCRSSGAQHDAVSFLSCVCNNT